MSEPVKVLLLMRFYANEYIFFKFVLFYSNKCVKAAVPIVSLFRFFQRRPYSGVRIGKDARTTCFRNAFRTIVAPRKRGEAQRSTRF